MSLLQSSCMAPLSYADSGNFIVTHTLSIKFYLPEYSTDLTRYPVLLPGVDRPKI